MAGITDALSDFVGNVLGFLIMLILAVVTFFLAVFVVANGAAMAGYSPDGNYVILSATLLVVAAALAGAIGGNAE